MPFVFAQAKVPAVPVWGEKDQYFPVRRIWCVGANYASHAAEVGTEGRDKPFFFSKPADALLVCKEGKTVEIPHLPGESNLCLECELVVAIGKTAPGFGKISPQEAEEYIWGYAAGCEFTRRDLQNAAREKRQPWDAAKAFDNSALISEIREKCRTPDMDNAHLWLYVNNQERQNGNTKEMIWNIREIVSEASEYWQLTAGDLIYTGTPAGSGPIKAGQTFEGGVQGAGTFSAVMR